MLAPGPVQTWLWIKEDPKRQLMRSKHLMNDICHKLHFAWKTAFVHRCPKAQAHQNAVKVISSHITGRCRQKGPSLSLVVGDKSLYVIIHQFVGQIHPIYPLNLEGKSERGPWKIKVDITQKGLRQLYYWYYYWCINTEQLML